MQNFASNEKSKLLLIKAEYLFTRFPYGSFFYYRCKEQFPGDCETNGFSVKCAFEEFKL